MNKYAKIRDQIICDFPEFNYKINHKSNNYNYTVLNTSDIYLSQDTFNDNITSLDIINLLHEIGHQKYFRHCKVWNDSPESELIHEYAATVFAIQVGIEYGVVLALKYRNCWQNYINDYRKKIYNGDKLKVDLDYYGNNNMDISEWR